MRGPFSLHFTSFSLLIPEHPEKVEDIGGYYRIPDENGRPARGHHLIDRPENKRRREEHPLQQHRARRPDPQLKERIANAGQRQWQRADPRM